MTLTLTLSSANPPCGPCPPAQWGTHQQLIGGGSQPGRSGPGPSPWPPSHRPSQQVQAHRDPIGKNVTQHHSQRSLYVSSTPRDDVPCYKTMQAAVQVPPLPLPAPCTLRAPAQVPGPVRDRRAPLPQAGSPWPGAHALSMCRTGTRTCPPPGGWCRRRFRVVQIWMSHTWNNILYLAWGGLRAQCLG